MSNFVKILYNGTGVWVIYKDGSRGMYTILNIFPAILEAIKHCKEKEYDWIVENLPAVKFK